MKKSTYLIAFALGASTITFAQNVGVNTDGSDPDANTLLHIKNDASSSKDHSVVRIENAQNEANDVTGVEIYNSGTGSTAQWDIYNPASESTDLRISNNGTDRITIQNDGDVGIGTTTPASTLDIQGSLGLGLTSITTSTTLNNTHNVVLCNSELTVTLPSAASNTGRIYYIKNNNSAGHNITIEGVSSETIEGSTTYLLEEYNQTITIISDGTNWLVIANSN